MNEQTYVIDIKPLGDIVYPFILNKLNTADMSHETKLNMADYIYKDLFTQAINCITNNITKTFADAANYPDFKYYSHIYIFNDSEVIRQFKDTFTYILVHLFNLLKFQTNINDNNCEYLMVSITKVYLVVTKTVNPF